MKSKLFVAYGSNLNLFQMAYRCPDSLVVDKGELQNFKLTFRRGVANIERCAGSTVPVLLWSVPFEDECSLDRYEGFPYLYDKRRVHVKTRSGWDVMAWVYVMQPGPAISPPRRSYLQTILEGYADAGFASDGLWSAVASCGPLEPELVELKTGAEPPMFFDKNGYLIKAGMTLVWEKGGVNKVIEYDGSLFLDSGEDILPLTDFKTREFTIVK